MVPSFTDVSPPDSFRDQPSQRDLVIRPNSDGNYQCRRCLKRFACHEPFQFHASKHGDAIEHIYIEPKQFAAINPYLVAFHGVYCHRSTHYVRVTISQPFGSTSSIQQIDEEVVLTFTEFLEKYFVSTDVYKYTVEKMEELDRRCCRTIQDTTPFSPKNLVKLLRSCFACIPTWRRFRSSRWPGTPDLKPTSPYPSTEAITVNDRNGSDAGDSVSVFSQPIHVRPSVMDITHPAPRQLLTPPPFEASALPENVIGIVAVGSFHSTSDGVHGNVLVATQSDTVKLLQGVHFGTLLRHTRLASQLQDIVGRYAYEKLLEFEKMHIDILDPVYSGVLPDALPIEVGEEIRLGDCSPLLRAEIDSTLDREITL